VAYGVHKLVLTFRKTAVQSGSVKLTDVKAGELYDLQNDPREWHNLYARAEAQTIKDPPHYNLLNHLKQRCFVQANCGEMTFNSGSNHEELSISLFVPVVSGATASAAPAVTLQAPETIPVK